MNIFYLHSNPTIAAKYHNDKHVVKMILESAQMLSTAHRELDDGNVMNESIVYKSAHKNHPSTKWARASYQNYRWLYLLFSDLCDEYTHRYGKVHLTDTKLREVLSIVPRGIDYLPLFTQPPQCMPDEYKVPGDSVSAYRKYYIGEKAYFSKWTNRDIPSWWKTKQYDENRISSRIVLDSDHT